MDSDSRTVPTSLGGTVTSTPNVNTDTSDDAVGAITYGSDRQRALVHDYIAKITAAGGVPKVWRDDKGRLCVDVANLAPDVKPNPLIFSEDGKQVTRSRASGALPDYLSPVTTYRRKTPKAPNKQSECPCGSGKKYRKCCKGKKLSKEA